MYQVGTASHWLTLRAPKAFPWRTLRKRLTSKLNTEVPAADVPMFVIRGSRNDMPDNPFPMSFENRCCDPSVLHLEIHQL